MNSELSVGGIFMPSLLLILFWALVFRTRIVPLLHRAPIFRFFVVRVLADLAILILLTGSVTWLLPASENLL